MESVVQIYRLLLKKNWPLTRSILFWSISRPRNNVSKLGQCPIFLCFFLCWIERTGRRSVGRSPWWSDDLVNVAGFDGYGWRRPSSSLSMFWFGLLQLNWCNFCFGFVLVAGTRWIRMCAGPVVWWNLEDLFQLIVTGSLRKKARLLETHKFSSSFYYLDDAIVFGRWQPRMSL